MTSPIFETRQSAPHAPQIAAAILAVSTNFLPIGSAEPPGPPPAVTYQLYASRPLSATSTAFVLPQRVNVLDFSSDIFKDISTRWGGYVTRRIAEILVGAHDFTGLKIPVDRTGRRAWELALKLFHPETPTPSVLPSEDGEILFVWHKAGWDIEISIGSEETEIWAHNRRSGQEFSGSVEEVSPEISKTLASLALT